MVRRLANLSSREGRKVGSIRRPVLLPSVQCRQQTVVRFCRSGLPDSLLGTLVLQIRSVIDDSCKVSRKRKQKYKLQYIRDSDDKRSVMIGEESHARLVRVCIRVVNDGACRGPHPWFASWN